MDSQCRFSYKHDTSDYSFSHDDGGNDLNEEAALTQIMCSKLTKPHKWWFLQIFGGIDKESLKQALLCLFICYC